MLMDNDSGMVNRWTPAIVPAISDQVEPACVGWRWAKRHGIANRFNARHKAHDEMTEEGAAFTAVKIPSSMPPTYALTVLRSARLSTSSFSPARRLRFAQ